MIIPHVYIRVSSRAQASAGGGAEDQERVCMDYIKSKRDIFSQDKSKLKVYRDMAISAYAGNLLNDRSELHKFYEKVKAGRIGAGHALICYSVDRLSRENIWIANTFIGDLVNHGIEIHDVTSGQVLKRDDQIGALISAIHLMRANNESKLKSERSTDSYKRRLEHCLAAGEGEYPVLTRQMPRWLQDLNGQYVIKSDMQRVIDFIFDSYIVGVSCGHIARELNERGWLHGKTEWRGCYVSKLISDKRLLGKHGKHIDFYPPAIDNHRFQLANQMLTNVGKNIRGRTRIAYRDQSRVLNLFSGVLKCGGCGGATTVNINSNRGEAFVRCRNTEEKKSVKCKSIRLKNIESHVLNHLHGVNIHDVINYKNEDNGELELLKSRLLEYKQHESELITLIESRKSEGKITRLDTIKELESTRDSIDDLIEQIEGYGIDVDEPSFDICTVLNMENILDPTNVHDRCAIRNSINNTISEMRYWRVGDYIVLQLDYQLKVIKHVMIIHNKTGALKNTIKIIKNNEVILYESTSFTIQENIKSNECIFTETDKVDVQEFLLMINYMDGIASENLLNWMRQNINAVLMQES